MLCEEVLRRGSLVGDPVDVDLVVAERADHVGDVLHGAHGRVLPDVVVEPREACLDVGADRRRRGVEGLPGKRALEEVRGACPPLVDEDDVTGLVFRQRRAGAPRSTRPRSPRARARR